MAGKKAVVFQQDNWTKSLDEYDYKDVVWGRPMILIDAVSKCRLRQLRLLLDAGINVNSKDLNTGQTALIRATYLEDSRLRRICTSMLINYGAKVKVADHMKRTALSWACLLARENSLKIFQSKPELDLAYDSVDADGNTNLLLACMSGNVNVVKTIAKSFHRNRLDVDRRNNQGETALSVAVKQDNRDMIVVLIDIAHVTNVSSYPIEFLTSRSHEKNSKSASARRTKPSTAQRKPHCNLPKIFNLYTEQLTNSYLRTCQSVPLYKSCESTDTTIEKHVEKPERRTLLPRTSTLKKYTKR